MSKNAPNSYPITGPNLRLAKEWSEQVYALITEYNKATADYMKLVSSLDASLGTIKAEQAKKLCDALDVQYRPEERAYAVETAYIEHGVAFLLVVDKADEQKTSMLPPPGTKLN